MSRFSTDGGFDPELFTKFARKVGHGGALGILYVGHGPDWVELGLDWQEKLVGVPATGVLASGPIVSLMDMATSMAIWVRSTASAKEPLVQGRLSRPAVPDEGSSAAGMLSRHRNVASCEERPMMRCPDPSHTSRNIMSRIG